MPHTRGPWDLEVYENGSWEISSQDGMIIAARNSFTEKVIEFHANARLIAAAPMLLEASIDLYKAACSQKEKPSATLWAKLEAAIAAATKEGE